MPPSPAATCCRWSWAETLAAAPRAIPREPAGIARRALARTADLFSGKDFVYRRDGEEFTLYSIGPDLKDDGGKR